MATNPRIPVEPPHFPKQKNKAAAPWVPFAIIVAAAILIALIAWLPKTPTARMAPANGAVPAQPTGDQVQFTNLNINPSPVGNQVYIDGQIFNAGKTAITGVMANVQFMDKNGNVAGSVQAPVQALTGNPPLTAADLTQAPIQPSQSHPIRIAVDHAPANWNHQMPEITVSTVTATTPGKK